MPKVEKNSSKGTGAQRAKCSSVKRDGACYNAVNISSNQSSEAGSPPAKEPKKRSIECLEEDEPQDLGVEMKRMIECFGDDISKSMVHKKKKIEQYTLNTLKSSNKKVDDTWKAQMTERSRLHEEFSSQVGGIVKQWEGDLDRVKDQEDKFQKLIVQQQKVFQQSRVMQSNKLKMLRQLFEQYEKGLEVLEKSHQDQLVTIHSEIKKEMTTLQKKLIVDKQQQDMASVRKSLQSMFF